MIQGLPSSPGSQRGAVRTGGQCGKGAVVCVCMCVCSWDLEKSVGRWAGGGELGGQRRERS